VENWSHHTTNTGPPVNMSRYGFLIVISIFAKNLEAADAGVADSCFQQQKCKDSLTIAVADFTQSLYAEIVTRVKQDNFVFSPLSIHSALTLLYTGSTDNSTTRTELADALGILRSEQLIKRSYTQLIESYKNQKSFKYGNSIWTQEDFNISNSFKNEISENFGAAIQNIDFTQMNSVDLVNHWISNQTNGLIPKLVQAFDASTTMFLANALFFKEKWLIPFQETNETGYSLANETFYGENILKVPMMVTKNTEIDVGTLNVDVNGNHNATFVTIPYINDDFEMQIILPSGAHKKEGRNNDLAILEDIIKKNVKRDQGKDGMKNNIFLSPKQSRDNVDDVRLVMPKFSVSSKFDAADALEALGVSKIFQDAELGKLGISDGIAVSKILHKAVVNVDEEGTEGAAATGVELVLLSGSFGEKVDVNVDRPFIFIVQDKRNNIPILVGRIKNPLQ